MSGVVQAATLNGTMLLEGGQGDVFVEPDIDDARQRSEGVDVVFFGRDRETRKDIAFEGSLDIDALDTRNLFLPLSKRALEGLR